MEPDFIYVQYCINVLTSQFPEIDAECLTLAIRAAIMQGGTILKMEELSTKVRDKLKDFSRQIQSSSAPKSNSGTRAEGPSKPGM